MNRITDCLLPMVLGLVLPIAAHAAEVSPPPYEEAQETYGLVMFIDGARGDVIRNVALDGLHGETNLIPNIKKYFMDNGVWVTQATTVFPTITGAGVPAVLTGSFPGRTRIPSLYFFDRTTQEYAILYIFNEAFQWNRWLSPDVKTIWEHFDGADDALAFGPALWRGADEHTSVAWNVKYAPGEFRAGLASWRRAIRRAVVGGLPARMIVAYNGWFDHKEHELGSTHRDMIPEYRGMDGLVGDAIGEFLEMIEGRKATGAKVNYYVALVSDHGHKDISETQSLENYLKTNFRVANVQKELTMIAGQAVAGKMPEDLSQFDCLIAAGEGHGLFYFPVNKAFRERPTLELLRDYPFRDGRIDIPRHAVQAPAVGFMLARDGQGGVRVYARVDRHVPGDRAPDESVIEKQTIDGVVMYRYRVLVGKDPLGFDAHPGTSELVRTGFHSGREWQLGTADSEYPDAVVQLHQIFDAGDRAPDFFLSAYQGVSIGDSVAAGSGSKHGGLTRDESWATLAFFGSGIRAGTVATARNVDMVPTMLSLMGKDYDPAGMDGEPVPEVLEMVRSARAAGQGVNVAAAENLKALEDHVAQLPNITGEALVPWARTFQALASRPIADREKLATLRRQAFDTIRQRTDDTARKVVRGERAEDFLARPRPDLPEGQSAASRSPANPRTTSAMSREIADASYRKIFELAGNEFDRRSFQNLPIFQDGPIRRTTIGAAVGAVAGLAVTGILGRFGFRPNRMFTTLVTTGLGAAAGRFFTPAPQDLRTPHAPRDDTQGQIASHIAVLERMRLAGMDVPAPQLDNSTRNGMNLAYRGLGGSDISPESRQALDDFVNTEARRAGEGSSWNPLNLLTRLAYRESPARFQADVGRQWQSSLDRLGAARSVTPVNLPELARTLPQGQIRDQLTRMSQVGESLNLGPGVLPSTGAPPAVQAPTAPARSGPPPAEVDRTNPGTDDVRYTDH